MKTSWKRTGTYNQMGVQLVCARLQFKDDLKTVVFVAVPPVQ